MQALTDRDLEAFIKLQGIEAELLYPGVPTPTVADAARALGVNSKQIIKSLVFIAKGQPLLVIAAGDARIAFKQLAETLELSRKQIRMATPEEALELSGYEVGAMPPFGHRRQLKTYLDSLSLKPNELVYGGGGTKAALLKITLATLHTISQGSWAALTEEKELV